MFTAMFPGALYEDNILHENAILKAGYYHYKFVNNDEVSLFQYSKGNLQYRDAPNGNLCIENKTYKEFYTTSDAGRENLTKDQFEAFLLEYDAKLISDYRVKIKISSSGLFSYTFECLHTEESLSLEIDSYLLTIIDDYFYFYTACEHAIIKLDKQFNEIDRKAYQTDRMYCECFDRFVFLYLASWETDNKFVEVFDLENFETVERIESDAEQVATMYPAIKTRSITAFGCGNRLYIWNGKDLDNYFVDKDVSEIYDKGDFVYVSFKGDSCLYAYSPDLKTCIHKKEAVVEDFCLFTISSQEEVNLALFRPCDLTVIGGLSYFVSWSDEEFFSNRPWNADVEQSIFYEELLQEGDNFSVCVHLNVIDNYATVVRQSLSALDEVFYKHAAYDDKPCSEKFTGIVELRFENSRLLDDEQRAQLVEASEAILENYIFYTGAATGEDCTLTVTFID